MLTLCMSSVVLSLLTAAQSQPKCHVQISSIEGIHYQEALHLLTFVKELLYITITVNY